MKYEGLGVGFLALSLVTDEVLVERAAVKLKLGMRVALAAGESLGPLGVNQVPSVVFVSKGAVVVAAASGERTPKFLEERTRELLRQ